MTDWIMISITCVYVVTTILISLFNYRSSKATLDMLAESKRQFDEESRPNITIELIHEIRSYHCIRFTNQGKQPAYQVRIELQQSFIDSIKEKEFKIILERQKGRECILGVGHKYDLFFGSNRYLKNTDKALITGTISYKNGLKSYVESFSIDGAKYSTFFDPNSDMGDLVKRIESQEKELRKIANTLDKIYQVSMKDREQKND